MHADSGAGPALDVFLVFGQTRQEQAKQANGDSQQYHDATCEVGKKLDNAFQDTFHRLSVASHQDDVKLVLAIQGFRLQPDRLPGLLFQRCETGRLLVQQQFNDVLMREHHGLAEFELA